MPFTFGFTYPSLSCHIPPTRATGPSKGIFMVATQSHDLLHPLSGRYAACLPLFSCFFPLMSSDSLSTVVTPTLFRNKHRIDTTLCLPPFSFMHRYLCYHVHYTSSVSVLSFLRVFVDFRLYLIFQVTRHSLPLFSKPLGPSPVSPPQKYARHSDILFGKYHQPIALSRVSSIC